MTNRIESLKENARKVREDAVHTAEAVWKTTRDTVKAAGDTAGVLIDRTREAADAAVKTTRRTIQNARIRGRGLEAKVRGMAAIAADRVEKVSHSFKQSQEAKVRSARGKKSAAIKAQRAAAERSPRAEIEGRRR